MPRLFRKQRPILSASVGGRTICEIGQAPREERPVVEFAQSNAVLHLEDAGGKTYRHDLTSVVQEGFRWGHFSVRVSEELACQADVVWMKTDGNPRAAFQKGEAGGLRFQPFYLRGSGSQLSELAGRGLFYRGFHFSGTVTPSNVSLSCLCDVCERSFRVQSFHAGFSQDSYFYCSRGPHTLVVSALPEGAPPPFGKADPESLAAFEAQLPLCSRCGGAFAYLNPFRCPHCGAPYIDFPRFPADRPIEYYGNHLYGDDLQRRKVALGH
jgi:hypothetical protein